MMVIFKTIIERVQLCCAPLLLPQAIAMYRLIFATLPYVFTNGSGLLVVINHVKYVFEGHITRGIYYLLNCM